MNTNKKPTCNAICVVDIKEGKIRAKFNDSLIKTYPRLIAWAEKHTGCPIEQTTVHQFGYQNEDTVSVLLLSKDTVAELKSSIDKVKHILDKHTFEDLDDRHRWCTFALDDCVSPTLDDLDTMDRVLPLGPADTADTLYAKWVDYFSEWGNVYQALIDADGYINKLKDGVLQLAIASEHI